MYIRKNVEEIVIDKKNIYICINVYYDLCMYKMRPSVREPQFNWKISRNSTRKIVR